jgi:hypothetical protein
VLLNIRRQDVRKLTLLSESVSSRKVCMLSDIDVG